ncbi:four helix bundle protein [Aequorivita marina]|nr:four helix bundle protein [Aequorivita sp. S2608]MDS1299132.1 four helix bundle protein [Aequorivita sp. S2608]
METQLIIAFEIGYISKETFEHLERKIQSIQGMITRFMKNIEKNIS